MTKFASHIAGVAMIALAALPAFALTHAAQAGEATARIEVGNLSSPTQAARFDANLTAAADQFCTASEKAPYEGSKITVSHASCVQAFRSEALSQLSSADRGAVEVAAANSTVQVAGR